MSDVKPFTEEERQHIRASTEHMVPGVRNTVGRLLAVISALECDNVHLLSGMVTAQALCMSHEGRIEKLESDLAQERAECLEQARCNGMGGERELALMAKLELANREIERLKVEGFPGVMHEVDRAFYDLTVAERNKAWGELSDAQREIRRLTPNEKKEVK